MLLMLPAAVVPAAVMFCAVGVAAAIAAGRHVELRGEVAFWSSLLRYYVQVGYTVK